MNILNKIYNNIFKHASHPHYSTQSESVRLDTVRKINKLLHDAELDPVLRTKFQSGNQIENNMYTTRIKTISGDVYIFPDGHATDCRTRE